MVRAYDLRHSLPKVTPQVKGLSVVVTKEWIEEEVVNDVHIFLCTIGDAEPPEVTYDLKVVLLS